MLLPAQAQTTSADGIINARLLVGIFGRVCAQPDSSYADILERSEDWTYASAANLGDPTITGLADEAWKTSFIGARDRTMNYSVFTRDTDGLLETCGVRFIDISYDEMVAALEASALFQKPKYGPRKDEEGLYCVATYPMAGRPHEIMLSSIGEGIRDGHLVIMRASSEMAEGHCPITAKVETTVINDDAGFAGRADETSE